MDLIEAAVAFPIVLAFSAAGTAAAIQILGRRRLLDMPNARSSHDAPVPRGGGVAVIGAMLSGWIALAAVGLAPAGMAIIVGGGVVLAAVSWLDDVRTLAPAPRLLVQVVVVAVCVAASPGDGLVFQGLLPVWVDRLAAALLWLWFINLYNFMDGIDGLTGAETAVIGLGLGVLTLIGLASGPLGGLGLLTAAAAIGFLAFNWQPARIFLGDVGSVPLGFFLGWLLLLLAAEGAWAAALLLPAYYLVDATVTLFRRLVRGEAVWRPHREHFYQIAVRRGWSHARVSGAVLAANLLLAAAAVVAEALAPGVGLALGALVVALLLLALARLSG